MRRTPSPCVCVRERERHTGTPTPFQDFFIYSKEGTEYLFLFCSVPVTHLNNLWLQGEEAWWVQDCFLLLYLSLLWILLSHPVSVHIPTPPHTPVFSVGNGLSY